METSQSLLYKLNYNKSNKDLNADLLDGLSSSAFLQPVLTSVESITALTLSAYNYAKASTIYLKDAACTVTLPEATGTGNTYKIVMGIEATGVIIVTIDTDNCHFVGGIAGVDTDASTALAWPANGDVDTITLDGVANGGKVGDWLMFTDVATNVWLLEGFIKQSGGSEVTPLSNAA